MLILFFYQQLNCPWLLVANIDCGGVFAQVIGTKACLPSSDWELCAGIIINKLRGELKYFEPGPKMIQDLVGKPVYVIPYLENLNLSEEDGLGVERRLNKEFKLEPREIKTSRGDNNDGGDYTKIIVVVIAYPHIAIADDIRPVEADSRFLVEWRREKIPLPYPHTSTVILPGSRLTRSDLHWLTQETKWGDFLREHLRAGGNILGICGGYQMLGMAVEDLQGFEGKPGITNGLKLLPIHTVMGSPNCKLVRPRCATLIVSEPLKQGIAVQGFELHCGRSSVMDGNGFVSVENPSPLLIFENGEKEGQSTSFVKGTYLHGVLQSAKAREYLLVPTQKLSEFQMNTSKWHVIENIDPLDRLADHLQQCGLSVNVLTSILQLNK